MLNRNAVRKMLSVIARGTAPAIEGILVSYGPDRGRQSPRGPRGFNFAKNRRRESEQKEKLWLIVTMQFYQPANCSKVSVLLTSWLRVSGLNQTPPGI